MIEQANDCGCCAGADRLPGERFSAPGLPAIDYRLGKHCDFKASLLARLSSSDYPALSTLRTRADDDFSIAYCDAAALMLDVLSFYQERIANEAYLRTFFAETAIKSFPDVQAALDAVKKGETELIFADGIVIAFWLNGSGSENCCAFRGGPFTESRYFGEGVGIAVKKGNETLVRALNHALYRLWERGIFTDLYLRYFPVGFY